MMQEAETTNLQCGVHDPRRQHQSASNLSVTNVHGGQASRDRVVRAPDEDNVHQAHPQHERDDAQSHDLILAKQSFCPNISPTESDQDDGQGEAGTPPTYQ